MSFDNGKAVLGRDVVVIPQSQYVTTNGTQYILAAMLPWFLAAARLWFAATGTAVYVTEGYRSYATQRAIFVARYTPSIFGTVTFEGKRWRKRLGQATAAVPGTSVHGFGRALDLGSGINASFTGALHLTWLRISHSLGFRNTGTSFGEPWHQEWTITWTLVALPATPTIVSAGSSAATPIESDDLMATPAERKALIDDLFDDPRFKVVVSQVKNSAERTATLVDPKKGVGYMVASFVLANKKSVSANLRLVYTTVMAIQADVKKLKK